MTTSFRIDDNIKKEHLPGRDIRTKKGDKIESRRRLRSMNHLWRIPFKILHDNTLKNNVLC